MAIEPKKINYDVAIKSTNHTRSYSLPPEVYTSDTAVQFRFNILDVSAAEFTEGGAVTTVEVTTRDGSFFQHVGETSLEGTTVVYDLKEAEGNHAGLAKIQLKINLGGDYFTSDEYEFKILNSISTGVPVEIYVQNWETLTAQANAYLTKMAADIEDFDVALETGVLATNIAAKLIELQTTYAPDLLSLKQRLEQAEANKVDKNGSGQVGWANIAQDARLQIIGTTPPAVVGVNAVLETNITDGAVSTRKTNFASLERTENLFDFETDKYGDGTKTVDNTGAILTSGFAHVRAMKVVADYTKKYTLYRIDADGIVTTPTTNLLWVNASEVVIKQVIGQTFGNMQAYTAKNANTITHLIFTINTYNPTTMLPYKHVLLATDYMTGKITAPTVYIEPRKTVYKSRVKSYDLDTIKSDWVGKTWLTYGDSLVQQGNGDMLDKGWQKYVNDYLGFAKHYGRGIGGTAFNWGLAKYPVNNVNGMYDPAIASGTTGYTDRFGSFCSWDRITAMIPEAIRHTLDVVYIQGGNNDFANYYNPASNWTWSSANVTDTAWIAYCTANGLPVGDYPLSAFKGSIASTIMKMQAWCPNAIIVLGGSIPTKGDTGLNATSPKVNAEGFTLEDFSDAMEDVAHYLSIPFVDIYGNAGINFFNRAEYTLDTIHTNVDGQKMLARPVIGAFKNILPVIV